PWINDEEISKEYNVKCLTKLEIEAQKFDAIILTVAHQEYLDFDLTSLLQKNGVVYDVKGVLPKSEVDKRL
ncbi:MAG: UDP binding domain-containing protein, partial [Algoriella sp.]